MIAAELARRGHPVVSDLGGLFYFAPASLQRAAALGLSPSQWYFLGRGGALGDVDAAVVDSALGYFAPSVVRRHWDSGRAVVPPRAVATAHMECCRGLWPASSGRRAVADQLRTGCCEGARGREHGGAAAICRGEVLRIGSRPPARRRRPWP